MYAGSFGSGSAPLPPHSRSLSSAPCVLFANARDRIRMMEATISGRSLLVVWHLAGTPISGYGLRKMQRS